MNIHWPATRENTWVPWYTILRRGLCVIPFVILFSLTVGVGLLGWGYQDARHLWKEVF